MENSQKFQKPLLKLWARSNEILKKEGIAKIAQILFPNSDIIRFQVLANFTLNFKQFT